MLVFLGLQEMTMSLSARFRLSNIFCAHKVSSWKMHKENKFLGFFLKCRRWWRASWLIVILFFFSGVEDDDEQRGSSSFVCFFFLRYNKLLGFIIISLSFFLKCRRWRWARRLVVICFFFLMCNRWRRTSLVRHHFFVFFLRCNRWRQTSLARDHLFVFFLQV